MYKLHKDLNADTEVQAIADYLSTRWSPIPNLANMVKDIKEYAFYDARAWISQGEISQPLYESLTRRKAILAHHHPSKPENTIIPQT